MVELNLEEIEQQASSPFIEKFEEFYNMVYRKEIEKIVEAYPEKRSLTVDFKTLEKYDPLLADELLDNPDVIIEAAETAIEQINIPSLQVESFKPHVRITNLPKDREINLKDISSKHLNKLICVEGLMRQITDVLPKLTLAVWKCRRCGNVYKIPQEKKPKLTAPNMCECHSREFELLEDKSGFIDYQKIEIQEPLEKLKGNEQAVYLKVFVSDDLVNKVSAGDKTKFVGILRLLPPEKENKNVYGKFLEVNYLEETQKEFSEVEVTKEEQAEIKKLAKDPQIYDLLTNSIAPAIYGHDVVKESIALQLFGGVTKNLPNKQTIRGNIHVLLIGDPGCLIGSERVIMGNGSIKRIDSLGQKHLEKIKQDILTGEGGKKRGKAITFFKYEKKEVIQLITESGKSITGTLDHPLLCITKENGKVKRMWKRIDEFKKNDKVATVNYIPCTIKEYKDTGFELANHTSGPLFKGKLPKKVTPTLGAILGYMLGDGWVREKEAYMVVADTEKELLPELNKMVQKEFGITPSITSKKEKNRNVTMHRIGLHSKDIAKNLIFLREKRVPQIIMDSGNEVVKEFIKWLYQADGCVFSKGRGSRSVSLKAKNIELLRDIQVLLLRFSIHSRIVGNTLMIRRGESIKKYGNNIGFVSKSKKEKMKMAIKNAENHERFGQQRSEKIVKIIKKGYEDVYDIEVENVHRFIANGIISHNCGKSQLLTASNNIAPKSIYISGKTTSGVGLCVAPDTLILNDSGFKPIKDFVEENFINKGLEEIPGAWSNNYQNKGYTLGNNLKISEGKISKIWRIQAPKKMIKIKSKFGKELSLTPNTSLIRIKNGKLEWTKSSELKTGDIVACARRIPSNNSEKQTYSIKILSKNKNIKIQNNVSKEFKEISDTLIKNGKYFDLGDLAKSIGKDRNTIYSWRIPQHYHSIPLNTFIDLAEKAGWKTKKISNCIKTIFISHGKNFNIPKTINNKDLAYLTGIIIGDGSIYLTKKSAQIRLYNNSIEVLNEFDRIISNLFGIKSEKYVQKNVQVRRVSSVIIYELMKEFGLTDKKIDNKLSHSLTELEPEILNSTLRGLFDTDGFVSSKKNPHIGISTISKSLAQTIQLSLLKSSIISKIRERKVSGKLSKGKQIEIQSKHNQFYVEIKGLENTLRFEEKIGFKVKRKQEALTKINIPKESNPNLDLVPELGKALKQKGIKWEYKSGKFNPNRKTLSILAKKIGDNYLRTLAESDILWEEIIEKKEFSPEYEYVYDFTVDGTHNFIANGFITHNTASAVKDEFGEGGWTLKAGALVLSSGGICMADELDKMDPQDRSALHEAMEQGMISVAKAGIVTRFKADTSLLAAANPKFSRFDPFTPFFEQIDLPASLISRFDLFFMIKDILDRTMDQKISEHILKTHQSGEILRQAHITGKALDQKDVDQIEQVTKPKVDQELLRKYISYARQRCFPVLSPDAMKTISDFYVALRDQGRNQKTYSATARQLEGLVRLSEASARVRLSESVEIEDAERAIRLVKKSLEETVTDPETGKIDIDIITTGVTQAKQNTILTVLRIVKEAMSEGVDMVPVEQIVESAKEKGLDAEKVMGAIDELERKGDIYKPRHHFVKPSSR